MIRIVWKCDCGNVNETKYGGNITFEYDESIVSIDTDRCLRCDRPYVFTAKLNMNSREELEW